MFQYHLHETDSTLDTLLKQYYEGYLCIIFEQKLLTITNDATEYFTPSSLDSPPAFDMVSVDVTSNLGFHKTQDITLSKVMLLAI